MPKYNNQKQEKELLEQITETLRTQKLTNQMQKELALLLLLRSILEEKKSPKNTQKIKIVDLAISSLLQHQELDEKNKFFIQQIRKKLDYESAEPNPLWAVLKGHGGAYNRLISGLTWYFILFVFLPSLAAGGIFFGGQYFEGIRDGIVKSEEKQIKIESQKYLLRSQTETELSKTQAKENNIPEQITDNDLFKRWFISQDIFFIYLAISMGALGSITSLVVRSKKYIEQSEEEGKDLFFVAFLHPFVGMSFALFTVALIESGIFLSLSGITDNSTEIENRQRTSRQIYYYMAIAFIAGFSERFVQDLVSKVDKLNDKPQKLEDDSSRLQEIEEKERRKEQERRLKFDEDSEIN
ncbi:MAG: hypothetical protein AAFW70_16775 [Cyanobacteria bacterium J06635_10]